MNFFLNSEIWTFVVVQSLSPVWLFVTPWAAALQASLSFTMSQSLLKFCPLNRWCHPTISSSVTPFSSCPQSFPASRSFPKSQVAKVLELQHQSFQIQCLFPLGLIGLLFLQSKGHSRVFSSTIVQKHQFFGTQPSLFHISFPGGSDGKESA